MKIGLDMDGCLVDFVSTALLRVKSLWGIDLKYENLVTPRIEKYINANLPEQVNSEALCKALFQPGFFIGMLPRPGAIKAVEELTSAGHEIYILTKAYLHSAHIVQEKADWLSLHLGKIPYRTIVLKEMESKHIQNVDIIIDDDPIALQHPTAISIAVEHPWNKEYLDLPEGQRKYPIHRIQSMDFLPWILDIAIQSKNVEISQKDIQPDWKVNYE